MEGQWEQPLIEMASVEHAIGEHQMILYMLHAACEMLAAGSCSSEMLAGINAIFLPLLHAWYSLLEEVQHEDAS
jgi:hypothetical protein